MDERRYRDRQEAGSALAQELGSMTSQDAVVYGLARGGVPVASSQARDRIAKLADEVHCLGTPASLSAVGQWYVDFAQVTNDEVRRIIQSHPNG